MKHRKPRGEGGGIGENYARTEIDAAISCSGRVALIRVKAAAAVGDSFARSHNGKRMGAQSVMIGAATAETPQTTAEKAAKLVLSAAT